MENYIGEIKPFCGDFAPAGWALCNGQLLPIQGNEALYKLLGKTYGGDANNFALPDLRGRAPIHNTSGYALGTMAGQEQATITAGQLPSHSHTVHLSGNNTANNNGPLNGFWAANTNQFMYGAAPGSVFMNAGCTSSTGNGMPHENRIPFVAVNYIIATSGFYPDEN
jgi:microcystin-dependent protein